MNDKDKDKAGNQQRADAGSTSGTESGKGADSGRHTGFAHAAPESNVGPAGASQTSHGSASGRMGDSQSGISGSASGDGTGASADGAPTGHERPIGSLADDKPSI